jgi:hypothetical protein
MALFSTLPDWWRRNAVSHAKVWHVVAMVGLLLAWGGQTPVGALMYHVPGYGLLRDQSRNLLELDLALAVLTAMWLDRSSSGILNARWAGIPLGAAGALVAGYAVNARRVVSWAAMLPIATVQARAVAPAVWTTGALVVAGGLLLGFNPPPRWRIPAWTALMAVNLSLYASGQYWVHPASTAVMRGAQRPWSALDNALRGEGRIALYDPSLADSTLLNAARQPDLNVLSGIYSVQGYGSVVSERYDAATGAHPQLGYRPRSLGGALSNNLNLCLLAARPDDFSHRIKPGQRTRWHVAQTLRPHRAAWLYFGRPLAVQQLRVMASAPANSRVQVAAVTAHGQPIASQVITVGTLLDNAWNRHRDSPHEFERSAN